MANIINKGVHCKIRAYGSGLVVGTTYTACLYAKANIKEMRAETTTTAVMTQDVVNGQEVQRPTCVFDFTPEKTAALKVGSVILEIYDTENLQQMSYNDNYAIVRATSLSE